MTRSWPFLFLHCEKNFRIFQVTAISFKNNKSLIIVQQLFKTGPSRVTCSRLSSSWFWQLYTTLFSFFIRYEHKYLLMWQKVSSAITGDVTSGTWLWRPGEWSQQSCSERYRESTRNLYWGSCSSSMLTSSTSRWSSSGRPSKRYQQIEQLKTTKIN